MWKNQKSKKDVIKNIKILHESLEKVFELSDDYSRTVSEENTKQNTEKVSEY